MELLCSIRKRETKLLRVKILGRIPAPLVRAIVAHNGIASGIPNRFFAPSGLITGRNVSSASILQVPSSPEALLWAFLAKSSLKVAGLCSYINYRFSDSGRHCEYNAFVVFH